MNKRIRWLINRLRVMSPPEVAFRAGRAVAQRRERRRVEHGWVPRSAVPVGPRVELFGNEGLAEEWKRSYRLDEEGLSRYLSGRIDFFGHAPLDIGRPVAWHRDPKTGRVAPRTFGKAIDYRDENAVGDVKFLWELGRHQHLIPLAVAYAVTGDREYRRSVVEQIEGWIEDNPYGYGIHWCSALELALRLIAWAVIHSLFTLREEKGLFAAVQDGKALGDAIYQQAWFIRHYLSRYSSANNHLIGELAGLWVATIVFDLGTQGDLWRGFAREELEREARRQVYGDGVDKEQAFYYHLWVLEYLLFCWLVALRDGQELSPTFRGRIEKMTTFLKDVAPEGGEPPDIGDADNGFVARFAPRWPTRPYQDVIAAVDHCFGGEVASLPQKAFWYGKIARLPAARSPAWERRYPVAYSEGGYAVLGGNGWHLVFDAGDLGYLGIAAHGHADALSFCLAYEGFWWIVDPGTYAYHGDPRWRNYFRGTSAHNTLRVAGRDQSTIGGPFLWLEKAHGELQDVAEVDAIQTCEGFHDGYERVGVRHQRRLSLDSAKGILKVVDHLTGSGRTQVEVFYHLAPEIQVSGGGRTWRLSRPGSRERFELLVDEGGAWEAVRGQEDPILGWYSRALGAKEPTVTLRGVYEVELPREIHTTLRRVK